MDELLQGLRAAAEGTRLRILGLCAHSELSVSELCEILGQSQPRVSRHLKLLVEAGLLERHQEGSWAYYHLADNGATGRSAAQLGRILVDLMPDKDPVHALDLERLQALKEAWAVKAAAYFKRNAANWERIQALHVDQARVDEALKSVLLQEPVRDLLDIGTGTGHVLELFGEAVESAVGIDLSRDMLIVARSNLWRKGLRNCLVRQADMMKLPYPAARFDAVTLHMVLHYAEDPAQAIAESTRVLKPGGRLVVADFVEHDHVELREEHAHRWLGFSDQRIENLFHRAGLVADKPQRLTGGPLTVCLWSGRRAANDSLQPVTAEAV
ncbi:MAG TPA: metalloregulator ArsR/SmtB family transcription factor [Kiloniellales bacterium]|nr:metalloregulator ArsR/SmtB family transcription factor [Kiloniellales bacterium]